MSRSELVNAVGTETGAVGSSVAPAVERPRPAAPPPVSGFAANLIPLAVATALFMEFIDSTALSTALPSLARAFHSDPVHLKLALTSYLLSLAACAPASGWVADRFGARRVFVAAMGVFLVGSALCGFSHSLIELIGARLVQGLGGAMMSPVGRLIIVNSTPRDRFVSAMSWFTMPALVGPLLGPPLAGIILGVADWPWIFFINIPVGVLGIATVVKFVPRIENPRPGRFDTSGFAWVVLCICALAFFTETVGVGLVPWPVEVISLGTCLAAGAIFLRHVKRARPPVLNLELMKVFTFRAGTIGGLVVRLGLGATPLLLPLLLQIGLGWSPMKAGLITIGQSLGAMLFKPVAAQVIRTFGYRNVLVYSALGTGVTVALPAIFNVATPVLLMVALLAVSGFVRSMHFTACNALIYADVERDQVSAAATLSTVIQQVSMSLGVSFGGLLLHLARGGAALTPDRFVTPFVAIGLTSLLAVPIYLKLSPDAGAEIGGRARAPA